MDETQVISSIISLSSVDVGTIYATLEFCLRSFPRERERNTGSFRETAAGNRD